MAGRAALSAAGAVLCASLAYAQTPTTTSFRAIFTVPSDADNSVPLIPNINDPQAVNAQDVCPGYKASNIVQTPYGLTAQLSLAGAACNVYGTDIEALNLTVEYQSDDRLHVGITPTYVDSSNSSWYILPEVLVTKPTIDVKKKILVFLLRFWKHTQKKNTNIIQANSQFTSLDNDLSFIYNNDPTFSFKVVRKSTGDVLFDTTGTQMVFENQFIEFASALPENYNLYGLGEVIHGLRMGNNFTRTFWAADAGDPIDYNIYGDHSFYLDTRYYKVNEKTGNLTYVSDVTNATGQYTSYSHGVYLRNSHGQEVLMRPSNITWRTLGGSVELYFYAGPTQEKVTKSYQLSATGLPAMQQYFTFGYHQCRWGYKNWSELQGVVDSFKEFGIPLENIW
jgi:alpha-glucosidase